MPRSSASDIEKKSLEAHVELCAERYDSLNSKLSTLTERMDTLENHVVEIKDKLSNNNEKVYKQLITIGTPILVALMTGILGLLVHLATK